MPNVDQQTIVDDLAVFADLGTHPPQIVEGEKSPTIMLMRAGERTQLKLKSDGSIEELLAGDRLTKYSSFRALLASERYGDLRSWAARQSLLLNEEAERNGATIKLTGQVNGGTEEEALVAADNLLQHTTDGKSTYVLLIDGPAGIGKTHFIAALARNRANNFSQDQKPLILHVESRGRQLSYIYDLIAFSLQRLRANTTFDQVPILVKHGLITIAIDGFDELADPNGYNLAWAQVNELVESVRGSGSLVLAGRETFIGRDRVLNDIKALDENALDVLTLSPPEPNDARNWLSEQGLTADQVDTLESFLERGSIALRPFFLKKLADPDIAHQVNESSSSHVLSILVESMLHREATKFGGDVDKELTPEQREQFVRNIMYEVARDLADNQTSAIEEAALSWLVEASVPIDVSQGVEFLLKNRASQLGFLTMDERPRHVRFFHEKFFEYFLSRVIIDTLGRKEVPKFITRNIFGSSFLETFSSVLSSVTDQNEVENFVKVAAQILKERSSFDRGRRNIGALLFASLHLMDDLAPVQFEALEMDEVRIGGTSAEANLSYVVINQLDARGSDLSKWTVQDSTILTMIVNSDTLVPDNFLTPSRIVMVSNGERQTITSPSEINEWLIQHSPNPPPSPNGLVPDELRHHPAIQLLQRACRMKQYWMRAGDDKFAERILTDPYWPMLEQALDANELLTIATRQASGQNGRFIHIRYPDLILSEDAATASVVGLYQTIISEISGS